MQKTFSIRNIAFPLAIAAGIFIIFSAVNIQGPLSTGDHGRDLYAAERTLHGDLAYRDYWWVYGPLMPFYYAGFMKAFGVSITSVLIGKALLKVIAGVFIFLALAPVSGTAAALLGTLWFYVCGQDFFFTYNHAGGTLCVAAITAMLMVHLRTLRIRPLWGAAFASLILCFIKLNFGIIGLGMTALTGFMTARVNSAGPSPERKFLYRACFVYFPALTALVYAFFLRGLPLYQIRQCMPYLDSDQTYNMPPWEAMARMWEIFIEKFFTSAPDFFFGCMIVIAVIRILYLAINKRLSSGEDRRSLLALGVLGIFLALNFHEYLKSGVWYRYLWIQPVEFVIFFTIMGLALRQTGRPTRLVIWGCVLLITAAHWQLQNAAYARIRISDQYIAQEKAGIFVTNNPAWIATVESTAAFLQAHLQPDETFLALPYDPIYYYLTGRKSPTQLLLFCDQQHIPQEQEKTVIADLERSHVNWVVVSSRMRSQEPGLGVFGINYTPRIAEYLQENFTPVTQFGDWQNEPGWAWNHGTMILKRK